MIAKKILGTEIKFTDMQELVSLLDLRVRRRMGGYICFANVHTLVTGIRDREFRRVSNSSAMTLADGKPLVWLGRLRGATHITRCSGPDVMDKLLEISTLRGYTHFFYGSTEETLASLIINVREKYPRVNIVGRFSPPFRQLTEREDADVQAIIKNVKPDIIWVGLGAPKQELWMSSHSNDFNSSLILGVGAAFDFFAGTVRRAPKWMQQIGLEWFYRLCKEPRRLWRRYLVTNTLFILYVARELLSDVFRN